MNKKRLKIYLAKALWYFMKEDEGIIIEDSGKKYIVFKDLDENSEDYEINIVQVTKDDDEFLQSLVPGEIVYLED